MSIIKKILLFIFFRKHRQAIFTRRLGSLSYFAGTNVTSNSKLGKRSLGETLQWARSVLPGLQMDRRRGSGNT